MTGQVPRKLRLVRCPKCRLVLPELPNVPVYQCGGCGTVLQAKKRQVIPEDAEPQATESVPVHKKEPGNTSYEKKAENSSKEKTNFETNQTEIQVCIGEHSVDSDSSPDISKKRVISGNRDSTVNIDDDETISKDIDSRDEVVSKEIDSGDEFVLKESESIQEETNFENNQTEIHVCNGEHSVDSDSSPDIFKKRSISGNRDSTVNIDDDGSISKDVDSRDVFVPKDIDSRDELVSKESESSQEKTNFESNQTEIKVCSREPSINADSSPDISKKRMSSGNRDSTINIDEEESISKDIDSRDEVVSTGFLKLINHGNIESIPDVEDDKYISKDVESLVNQGNLKTALEKDEYLPELIDGGDEKKNKSRKDKKLNSHISFSDELIFSPEFNHLEHEEDEISDKIVLNNDKSFYNHEHMSSIDTLDNIVALRDFPESPITRSYYGFYGSSSSCDGNDDHAPDRNFHISKRTFKKEFNHGKSLETPGQNGYLSSNSYRNYSNDEVDTKFHLPNKREYLEVEKMELLKKVRELEDQLKKSQICKGNQKGNFSKFAENQDQPYYDDLMYTTSRNIHTNKSDAIKVRAERLYLGKKHSLPVTGGAPFLLCYNCSEVLQVPTDFILFKRRYHKLKCGNCSVILKFSLKNRTQIVKYIDHNPKDLSENEPVLIDEPGPSFCKSFSTEESPSLEPQLDDMKKSFREKNISNSKKGSKFTNFVRNLGYVRSSSKRSKAESSTSESEEVPASANSPLHRLMGYHSATILLKADAQW